MDKIDFPGMLTGMFHAISNPLRILRLCLAALALFASAYRIQCTHVDGSMHFSWQVTAECIHDCDAEIDHAEHDYACVCQGDHHCAEEVLTGPLFTPQQTLSLQAPLQWCLNDEMPGMIEAAFGRISRRARDLPATGPPCPSSHLSLVSSVQQLI